MQISPRYEGPVILDVEGVGDPSAAVLRQRGRLADVLSTLTDEQWAAPSRCDGWSIKDVVAHLVGTDQFWAIAFGAALRGEPTRFLATFDPVATPAAMVERERSQSPHEVLEKYRANIASLAEVIDGLDDAQWSLPSEAPPGHVALRVAALHALWDAWIHERDIVIPLDLPVVEDDEEVELVLRYVVGLSPGFYAAGGSTREGTLLVDATDPSLRLQVEAGTSVRVTDARDDRGAVIEGSAVDIIEGLSHRAPLNHQLGDDDAWLLLGLAQVFDKV